MSSITHFEDLPLEAVLEALELKWFVTEKFDGSFVEAGLDDQGIFYTRRKGGQPIYALDELPEECWTSTYRAAHTVLSGLLESLSREDAIRAGQHIGFEIIDGTQPNTIPYKHADDIKGGLVVTSTSWPVGSRFDILVNSFSATIHVERLESPEGSDIIRSTQSENWWVRRNPRIFTKRIMFELEKPAENTRYLLDHWLTSPSNVLGLTNREILEVNLSRKHPLTGDRKWGDFKEELKRERDKARKYFQLVCLMFKQQVLNNLDHNVSGLIVGFLREGVVVKLNSGILFKLVDRPMFTELNRFTHLVKYWIVGGRRPARPSFLSRTKDWDKKRRLERLEKLRTRYVMHYMGLAQQYVYRGQYRMMFYSGDLHKRTLNLFADVRKRIEDGR